MIKSCHSFALSLSVTLVCLAIMKLLSVFLFASVVVCSPTMSLECLDNSGCDDNQRCSISLSKYTSTCVSATLPAQFNELCQGSMDVDCASGLYCSHSTELTEQFDAGVCLHSSKKPSHGFSVLGGVCGGFTGATCPEGLQCKMFEEHFTDIQGVCYDAKASLQQEGVSVGGLCGGVEFTSCAPGLECGVARPHSRNPFGVCLEKKPTQ